MNRSEVYHLIDGERDYQISRWKTLERHHEIGTWLAFMQHYLTRAIADITKANHREAMCNIRKIAALAVVAMEDHGAPERHE